MLVCDWCREPIGADEPEARLQLVRCDPDHPILRGWPTFHEACGIMALRSAEEHIEDRAPGERPDPATEELLEQIPTCRGEDGPVSFDLRLVRHLGDRRVTYRIYETGIHTLLDASFRTRAEVAAIAGVGPGTLEALQAAMRRHGLVFRDEPPMELRADPGPPALNREVA